MLYVITALHVIVCFILIVVVLLQSGKAADFAPTATVEVALSRGHTVVVELDTSGAIDVAAERARLGRDLTAAQKELDQAEKKLGNPAFVAKAPGHVVDDIRGRQARAAADLERLTARLAALSS